MRCIVALVCLSLACGCEGGETANVLVDLRTDFVPGVEFVSVRTTMDDPARADDRSALRSESFVEGIRVAELTEVGFGSRRLTLNLLDVDGAVVASRSVRLTLSGDLGVTVSITRDCADVSCGPSLTCSGATCVPEECIEGMTGDRCALPACIEDVDCAPMAECARPRCLDGLCLYEEDAGACSPDEYCKATDGCTRTPSTPDGSMPDTSMPDTSPPDAPLDTAIPCGDLDQMCCGGSGCAMGLTCDSGICTAGDSGLVEGGVLVRYFLDETSTALPVVSSAMPLDLSFRPFPPTLIAAVSETTGRGFDFQMVGSADRICAPIAGSGLMMLNGGTTGTIEAVADLVDGHTNSSRVIAIGANGEWGFSIGFRGASRRLIFSMNRTRTVFGDWAGMPSGRHVYTVVLDLTQPTRPNRLRLYIDGAPGPPNAGVGMDGSEILDVGADSELCIGNSEDADRGLLGRVYYGAYYRSALSSTEVLANVGRLLADDD